MKKRLKPITPINDTKNCNPIPGSVGEFVEILKDFPQDSKFTLNGNVNIKGEFEEDEFETNIYKAKDEDMVENDLFFNFPEDKSTITNECECQNNVNCPVMDGHLFGIAKEDPHFTHTIRTTSADRIIESPIMMPNKNELSYEANQLAFNQLSTIDEIRRHNMYVAEYMGEMRRREIAALLEYNTQCLAHFGVETNKVMCTVVDLTDDED